MNISILNTLYYSYKVGGAERSVQLLAEDLRKANLNFIIISLTDNSSYCDKIKDVKIYHLTSKNLCWPNNIKKSYGMYLVCI